jgi:hypothetical protein
MSPSTINCGHNIINHDSTRMKNQTLHTFISYIKKHARNMKGTHWCHYATEITSYKLGRTDSALQPRPNNKPSLCLQQSWCFTSPAARHTWTRRRRPREQSCVIEGEHQRLGVARPSHTHVCHWVYCSMLDAQVSRLCFQQSREISTHFPKGWLICMQKKTL